VASAAGEPICDAFGRPVHTAEDLSPLSEAELSRLHDERRVADSDTLPSWLKARLLGDDERILERGEKLA